MISKTYRLLASAVLLLTVLCGQLLGQHTNRHDESELKTTASNPISLINHQLKNETGPRIEMSGNKQFVSSHSQGDVGENREQRDFALTEKEPYRLTGRFHLEQGTSRGYLVLQCQLMEGSYIHSLSLPKDMFPTVIQTEPSTVYRTGEQFQPDRPPTVVENDPIFGERMEKHAGSIQFFVPIELVAGVDPLTIEPRMEFNGQVCSSNGTCLPLRKKAVVAKFAGYFSRPTGTSAADRRDSADQ